MLSLNRESEAEISMTSAKGIPAALIFGGLVAGCHLVASPPFFCEGETPPPSLSCNDRFAPVLDEMTSSELLVHALGVSDLVEPCAAPSRCEPEDFRVLVVGVDPGPVPDNEFAQRLVELSLDESNWALPSSLGAARLDLEPGTYVACDDNNRDSSGHAMPRNCIAFDWPREDVRFLTLCYGLCLSPTLRNVDHHLSESCPFQLEMTASPHVTSFDQDCLAAL